MDFEAYVAESRSTLVRFATVITDDAHLAQDIVQEVLVRTQRKWHLIESMTYPEAYVRRMIVNEARSGWRRTKRVEPRSDIDPGATAADHSLTYERRDELRRRLLQLPPKQRAAVVMRYLEDLPDVELAATLNCTVSTVRVHVHRALARMRVDAADDPSRADGVAPPPAQADDLDLVPATPSDRTDRRARRIAAPLAIAAATVVLAGGAAVLARQGGDTNPEDAADAPSTSVAVTSSSATPAPRRHQPTTPVLDVFAVTGTKNVETYLEPEGEDLHGQQLVHKQLSGDRTMSLIVAPEKAFDDTSISKSRPVEIAGTTGHYAVVRLFPLSADGKGGSAPMGTVIFHTPDGKWAFAYLKKNTDNNTQDGTPVDDPHEIVAGYNRLQVSFTSGQFRTPLKLKYLPADARLSAAGSADGLTIDGRSDDLTTLDGSKQISVTLMDSNPGFVDGTDCREKALGCTTRLHRDFAGHTLLVDGIGYSMAETRKVFDNVQLAADLNERSTYFTLADAIG